MSALLQTAEAMRVVSKEGAETTLQRIISEAAERGEYEVRVDEDLSQELIDKLLKQGFAVHKLSSWLTGLVVSWAE